MSKKKSFLDSLIDKIKTYFEPEPESKIKERIRRKKLKLQEAKLDKEIEKKQPEKRYGWEL